MHANEHEMLACYKRVMGCDYDQDQRYKVLQLLIVQVSDFIHGYIYTYINRRTSYPKCTIGIRDAIKKKLALILKCSTPKFGHTNVN